MRLLIVIGKRDRARFNFFFCLSTDRFEMQNFFQRFHVRNVLFSLPRFHCRYQRICFALPRKLSELSNNDSLYPVVKYVLKTLNPLAQYAGRLDLQIRGDWSLKKKTSGIISDRGRFFRGLKRSGILFLLFCY